MATLAADLSDGWIDGQGASGHDARITADANIASAAVLVEAMTIRLHVYGANATQAMDQAMRQFGPNTPASSTSVDVAIPADTFAQAARTLQAAQELSGDLVIRIYYGHSATQLDQVLDIKNVGEKCHVVEDLAAGIWYFAVAAYNAAGRESLKFNIASKPIMIPGAAQRSAHRSYRAYIQLPMPVPLAVRLAVLSNCVRYCHAELTYDSVDQGVN